MADMDTAAKKASKAGKHYSRKEIQAKAKREKKRRARAALAAAAAVPHSSPPPSVDDSSAPSDVAAPPAVADPPTPASSPSTPSRDAVRASDKRQRHPTGKSPDRVTRSCTQPTVPSGNAATARAAENTAASTPAREILRNPQPHRVDLHLATKEQLLAELKLRDAEADDEKAMAWDEAKEEVIERKLVSYSESRKMADLPQTNRGEGERRCVAWQRRDPETGKWVDFDIGGVEGSKFDLIQTLDLDGDGDLEIITCEERENLGIFWYENPST